MCCIIFLLFFILFSAKRSSKPVPGGGKAKPAMRPKPSLPKCKVLFDYQAQDLDELNLVEGDVIEILKEGGGHYIEIFCKLDDGLSLFQMWEAGGMVP